MLFIVFVIYSCLVFIKLFRNFIALSACKRKSTLRSWDKKKQQQRWHHFACLARQQKRHHYSICEQNNIININVDCQRNINGGSRLNHFWPSQNFAFALIESTANMNSNHPIWLTWTGAYAYTHTSAHMIHYKNPKSTSIWSLFMVL